MNNNFQQLLDVYQHNWERVVKATSLDDVEKTYMIADESRDNALNWIFENVEEGEEQTQYFEKFGRFESKLLDDMGDVPVVDDTFDVFESFDEYETYYQRYGCEAPEFIVSWDSENVLWTDGLTIDFIKRPDILMGGTD